MLLFFYTPFPLLSVQPWHIKNYKRSAYRLSTIVQPRQFLHRPDFVKLGVRLARCRLIAPQLHSLYEICPCGHAHDVYATCQQIRLLSVIQRVSLSSTCWLFRRIQRHQSQSSSSPSSSISEKSPDELSSVSDASELSLI